MLILPALRATGEERLLREGCWRRKKEEGWKAEATAREPTWDEGKEEEYA